MELEFQALYRTPTPMGGEVSSKPGGDCPAGISLFQDVDRKIFF